MFSKRQIKSLRRTLPITTISYDTDMQQRKPYVTAEENIISLASSVISSATRIVNAITHTDKPRKALTRQRLPSNLICAVCGCSAYETKLLHCTQCPNYSLCLNCAFLTTHLPNHTFNLIPFQQYDTTSSSYSEDSISSSSYDIQHDYLFLLSNSNEKTYSPPKQLHRSREYMNNDSL